MTLGGRKLSIETGRMAKQANGSVVVRYGDTMVLVTACANLDVETTMDFFPLQCEYKEKTYAGGKFPGGFIKREGRPSDYSILASRLIDRPIRPMFADGFNCETQIIATLISSDGENPADVLSIVGASAALAISNIPFLGPIASVRVGKIGDDFIINPTNAQMEECKLEIVVAGDDESVLMVEGELQETSEDLLVDAIEAAHVEIKKIIDLQKELVAEINPVKVEITPKVKPEELGKLIEEKAAPKLDEWRELATKSKKERAASIKAFTKEMQAETEEEYPDDQKYVKAKVDEILKNDMRNNIVENQVRLDGRKLDEIRNITCEVGVLPRVHGSALFTRGETQSLGTVTLGSKSDEQIIDGADRDEYKKNFYLHYNFPPFCVGEVGRLFGPKRREIGHGNLAERALKNFMPDSLEFPYTVRIVSEVLESNGSSSMATVCSGSLAMMQAGVPIKKTIAGIAMGMIKDEKGTFVLSDILGSEDHYGDMDFKVTGSKDGITAIQMDLKVKGISTDVMRTALEQARKGRLHIIGIMETAIEKPQNDISKFAPKMLSTKIDPKLIGELIGPGGKNIKRIQEDSGATVEIDDDGTVYISGIDSDSAERAKELIIQTLAKPEEGVTYEDCRVTRLESYGAFVELIPGTEGLLHISEYAWERTADITKVLKLGDKVTVKLKKITAPGKFEISRKILMEKPEGYVEPPKKSGGFRRDNNRSRR